MGLGLIHLKEKALNHTGTLSVQAPQFFQVGKENNLQFIIMTVCQDVSLALTLADTMNYHLFLDLFIFQSYCQLLYAFEKSREYLNRLSLIAKEQKKYSL